LRYLKLILVALLLSVNLMMATNTFAQINVDVPTSEFPLPTLLPQEDADFSGYRGECIGLATMIRTGNISLRSIPCFIRFFSQTLIAVAGSLSVVFIMIGGYLYVVGRDEDKDKAKKTITYAIIGLAIALMAWIITDIVLQVATE